MRPVVFLFAAGIFGCARAGAEPIPITIPEQDRSELIRFSHRQHLVDFGLRCTDCHAAAPTSTSADQNILPRESNCGTCHAAEIADSLQCGKCHLGNPQPFENPERVISFPHATHTGSLKIGCETCHRGMAETNYAHRANWPAMPECLACHQDREAPYDCDTCHPKVEVLRPATHGAAWLHEHPSRVRTADMPCSRCHDDAWCEDCHAGAQLASLENPTDRAVAPSPMVRGRVVQTLARQHELNYRYTHPLDAGAKERRCATCHDRDYCIDCHRVEGQEARFKPVWHGPLPAEPMPWVLPGVGSGGGRHGTWARRDIETCVACHDVEGADPSCVQCHADLDGIRGTDPRTHPRGFAERAGEGDFHEDGAALCYACHLDTGAAGQGFCGYCHR